MSRPAQPYALRPAAGQALLNYQNRLQPREMPLYEADTMEQVRDDKSAQPDSYLLQSDCLSACAWLKAQNLEADLVYIDPPFASGIDYAKKIWLRGRGKRDMNGDSSLGEEVMYGDIWKKEDYLNWLYERLLAIREVMSEAGSIYAHLDWHIGHYVKILMDEVFGEDNFRNEIVWHYRRWTAPGSGYQNMHDVIFFYGKSNDMIFNKVEVDPTDAKKSTIERGYHTNVVSGSNGSRVRQILVYDQDKVDDKIREGKLDISKYDRVVPVDATKVIAPDVWIDINFINSQAKEKTGYPTQKPEALLERIIKASSDAGMLVADFFSGSGTTAKVAHDLGRRFVTSDFGQNAVQTTRDRLAKAGAHFDVLKVRDGVRLFRNPAQTEEKIFPLLTGWQPAKGDKSEEGLNQFWEGSYSEGNRRVPVKYAGLDRKLTMDLIAAVLEEAGQADVDKALVLYAHRADNVTQQAVNREAQRHQHSDCRIVIRSLDELLESKSGQITTEDSVELDVCRQKDQWQIAMRKYYSPYLTGKADEHNDRAGLDTDKRIVLSDQGFEAIECLQFGTLSPKGVWRGKRKLEFQASSDAVVDSEYAVPSSVSHLKIRNIAGDEIIVDLAAEAKRSE